LISLPFDKIHKTQITRYASIHRGAFKTVEGRKLRVSTIGRTFLDMLRRLDYCGGMRHVMELFGTSAGQYRPPIIDELERHGNAIVKARAGYLLEEHARIQDVGDRRLRAISFFFGRCDSPSASLRTRHVSLVHALALETATRIPGRRTVPPCGRDRPVGRFENPGQKDETRDQRRVVLIGQGEGGRLSMRATGIGVPPLSPLPASRAYRRLASGSDIKGQDSIREDDWKEKREDNPELIRVAFLSMPLA
jgi:hypothetical protein